MHNNLKMLIIPTMLLFLAGCSLEATGNAGNAGNTRNEADGVTQPVVSQAATMPQQTTPQTTKPPMTKPALSEADMELVAEWEDKIYPGTTIHKIDVGGLTIEEARALVEEELMEPLDERRVRFSYANTRDWMSYDKLEVAIDDSVYANALASGKSGSEEEKLQFIKNGREIDLQPMLTFDEDYVDEVVERAARAELEYSREKIARRVEGRMVLRDDASDAILDKEAYKNAIIRAIDFNKDNNKYIEPVVSRVPTKVTQDQLDPIDTKLTTFATRYRNSSDSRKYNIALAADMISSTLIMPGSEYSFNRSIGGGAGERNGFQAAGIYSGLDLVQEPGGGVCQVSSTIYNIALNLGITPTQRDNHGMKVSYLPAGMDAVVYSPYLDLKFRNPFDDPIYIIAHADGEELRFNVYGAADALGGYSYDYEQEVYDMNEAVTDEIKDPSIPRGAIVLDPSPKDGYKAKVYKLTYKNGDLIKRELFTDDEYKRSDGKLRIGTGKGDQVDKNWYKDRDVKQYPDGWDGPRE